MIVIIWMMLWLAPSKAISENLFYICLPAMHSVVAFWLFFCVGIMMSIRMSQMCLPGCLRCVYQDVSDVYQDVSNVYQDVSDVSIRMYHMCLSGCLHAFYYAAIHWV